MELIVLGNLGILVPKSSRITLADNVSIDAAYSKATTVRELWLDMSGVKLVDCGGLVVLLSLSERLVNTGKPKLRLIKPQKPVISLMNLFNVETRFSLYEHAPAMTKDALVCR